MAEVEQQSQETREARFARLATKRTQVVLQKISLIGNLASSSYRYTHEQVQKIVEALRDAVDEVERKFGKQKEPKHSFTL